VPRSARLPARGAGSAVPKHRGNHWTGYAPVGLGFCPDSGEFRTWILVGYRDLLEMIRK